MAKPTSDDWMNEPLMGYSEDQLGPLGLPLPKQPDHFATVMGLLSAGPKILPETTQMVDALDDQDSSYVPVADNRSPLQAPSNLPTFPKIHEYMPEAAAVYGETASLRPQLIDPTRSAEDPSNWQPESVARLAQGRADIAALYARNKHMYRAQPTDFMNPIQLREWNSALQAASKAPEAERSLDPRINRLYMFQEGLSKSPEHDRVLAPIGPFRKRGAGDVINGDNAYIDLYPDRPARKK